MWSVTFSLTAVDDRLCVWNPAATGRAVEYVEGCRKAAEKHQPSTGQPRGVCDPPVCARSPRSLCSRQQQSFQQGRCLVSRSQMELDGLSESSPLLRRRLVAALRNKRVAIVGDSLIRSQEAS